MSDERESNDEMSSKITGDQALFTQLVLSFQAAAWQQMGKVASVISGKVERNLEMARHSIDMLMMLEEKTKGNLNEDESKYLAHVLYELRMNYLDEMKKGPDKNEEEKSSSDSPDDEESGKSGEGEKK
jgi:hypothetical protein